MSVYVLINETQKTPVQGLPSEYDQSADMTYFGRPNTTKFENNVVSQNLPKHHEEESEVASDMSAEAHKNEDETIIPERLTPWSYDGNDDGEMTIHEHLDTYRYDK